MESNTGRLLSKVLLGRKLGNGSTDKNQQQDKCNHPRILVVMNIVGSARAKIGCECLLATDGVRAEGAEFTVEGGKLRWNASAIAPPQTF